MLLRRSIASRRSLNPVSSGFGTEGFVEGGAAAGVAEGYGVW